MRQEAKYVLRILTRMSDKDPSWAATPPSWGIPVAVACNVTLIAREDLFIRAGAALVYPEGVRLHLITGLDLRTASFADVQFYGRSPRDELPPARLVVRFPDGRVADSAARPRKGPLEPLLRYDGGGPNPTASGTPGPRHEGWWWITPAPPEGTLEISAWLRGSSEPTGMAVLDLRPGPGAEPGPGPAGPVPSGQGGTPT